MPSVTHLNGDAGMAGFTQSHEVARFIPSTFGKRKNMVYFFGNSKSALLLAFLAQRVRFDVTVADAFPCSSVAFVGSWVALVLVVVFGCNLLMLGTVLPAVFGKPTAAGV